MVKTQHTIVGYKAPMIKRRSLLNAICFAPAIIPSASLMNLSWRSSKLLLTRPPLRRLSANWTFENGAVESIIDPVDEIALMLRHTRQLLIGAIATSSRPPKT